MHESVQPKKKVSKCVRCTGFEDFKFRDALEMLFALLIPATIGILAVVLQQNEIEITQKNRDNDMLISNLQRASDEQQTMSLAYESTFNTYVSKMTDVMLRSVDDGNLQYTISRVLALMALRQLNSEKKRLVIQFLYDTQILKRSVYVFNLPDEEKLEEIKNLRPADLNNVDFSGGLNLSDLVLRGVSLVNASFTSSDIRAADFTDSILNGVSFLDTKLDNTLFSNTQLQRTDFTGASVKNIRLIQCDLTQSTITDSQIAEALFVFNLILPNGTYASNKTFLVNGNAKQGLFGWNVTSGKIQVEDSYFFGKGKAKMSQRINTTLGRIYGYYESFQYCISLLVHRPEDLSIELSFLDQTLSITDALKIAPIIPDFCNNASSNSLSFCYWSFCKDSVSGTDFIDLTLTFQYNNGVIPPTEFTAVKNIEFTITT